jgi:hypothetical protein
MDSRSMRVIQPQCAVEVRVNATLPQPEPPDSYDKQGPAALLMAPQDPFGLEING